MNRSALFLLVEDNETDVESVQMLFKDSGHEMRVVSDGQQAIRYLSGKGVYSDRRQFPLPHLILLDLKMPRVNGFEFLKWLRLKSQGDLSLLPVVIMRAPDEPADLKLANDLGVSCYLTKPVSRSEFGKRMKTMNIFWRSQAKIQSISAP